MSLERNPPSNRHRARAIAISGRVDATRAAAMRWALTAAAIVVAIDGLWIVGRVLSAR